MLRKYYIYCILFISAVIVFYNLKAFKATTKQLNKVTNEYKYFIYEYIIRPSSETCASKRLLILIVTSYVGNVGLRSAHRKAMPANYLASMNISRIFLLAKIPDIEKYTNQDAINIESNLHGDILQGSFIENYRNLTHKHLMGLHWASTECHSASFILKVDDDTVFNINRTHKLLTSNYLKSEHFFMGYMLNNTKPIRKKTNKWFVTWNEYPRNSYPTYLSGWYYVTTPKTATLLCKEATHHSYFWIDDIFVTGLLTEALSIKLYHLPDNFWLEYYELLECCLKDMITKYIRCDHVVGPNGGRTDLIFEYNEALQHCNAWQNCTIREINQPLNKVCVLHRDRTIFSVGQAVVQNMGKYSDMYKY